MRKTDGQGVRVVVSEDMGDTKKSQGLKRPPLSMSEEEIKRFFIVNNQNEFRKKGRCNATINFWFFTID